tara:strand:+ start:1283 stop:1843 length:561 start_codon:yes stop_codon:yes gene_type:complete
MRIISGIYKGKKIFLPKDKETRPLRDLVKESIFNLIIHSKKFNIKIENSNILDLFSGCGSFGLECISRGAKNILFIEYYLEAVKVLRKNVYNLKEENKCSVIQENCFNYIKGLNNLNEKFDIIFIDPPYKEKNINDLIETILDKKILKKRGIVIVHRHKKDTIKISQKLKILDERLYGISKIIIGN